MSVISKLLLYASQSHDAPRSRRCREVLADLNILKLNKTQMIPQMRRNCGYPAELCSDEIGKMLLIRLTLHQLKKRTASKSVINERVRTASRPRPFDSCSQLCHGSAHPMKGLSNPERKNTCQIYVGSAVSEFARPLVQRYWNEASEAVKYFGNKSEPTWTVYVSVLPYLENAKFASARARSSFRLRLHLMQT